MSDINTSTETAYPSSQAKSSSKLFPYLALLFGVVALSFSGLFVRWAEAPGMITSLYRMLLASVFMAPILVRQLRKPGAKKIDWWMIWLPLLGGLFTSLDHAGWSTSIEYTRVANATLLNNISPLWVALVAWLFWKERLSWRFWFGLFLTLCGAVVVSSHDLLTDPSVGTGDLMAIGSSLFYAGYFLVTQRGRQYFQTIPYVYLVIVTSGFFLLIFNLMAGNALTGYSPRTYMIFVAAALLSQMGGYFSISYALGHLPAAVVAPTMLAQPVLTAIMAIPLIGEPLMPAQWIGGLIILTGIFMVNRR